MWKLIGNLWVICLLRLAPSPDVEPFLPEDIVHATLSMNHLTLRDHLDWGHPLPSLRLSFSPPQTYPELPLPPSTASTTPPPSYRHRQHRWRSQCHQKGSPLSSSKEDRPLCQHCLPRSQETQDRLACLTKEESLKSALKDFYYLVMRDGVQEAVEAMRWVLLQEGVELEHNVLGCSYCQVVSRA